MNKPEIRINFSELLYGNVSPYIAKEIGENLPSMDECYEWSENYRQEWLKYESILIAAITETLDLHFHKQVIDVSLAPFFIPQSDPLIVNFRNNPDQFVDVLTHELLHILLTDNNKVRIRDTKISLDLVKTWGGLFGTEHDFDTLIHIPVHAMLKYMYLDVFKEEYRLARDIKDSSSFENSQPYINAWEYVNQNDYKEIIAELKKSYDSVEHIK